MLGIAPDGNSLIMMVPNNGDATERQIGLSDGREQPPLALGNDFDSVLADPVSRRIIGTMQLSTATSYKFFDDGDQKSWDSLTRAFPGENIGLVSWSDDRKHVVVRVDGARSGAAYFLVDLNTYRAAELGRVYGDIAPADVAEVKFITYSAADGRKIPAYLTLPAGKAAKNLPLIVLPHGGPAVRDTPEFDWWAQALASRGYAVLQPQFRGSDGFGWEHMAAGFGEWGRKMQTDLSDGVRALTADGTVDPKRVCIVGASYGGYAALAGPTLDRGVYRCAVAVSGVSDPHEFLEWSSRREHADDSRGLRYWARFMGVTDKDDPKLTAISPLAHAADVDVPILLIHGRDDTVVPIAQSEDMERALRRAGKTVTFVELGGEDHWLSKSETRLKMLQATVAFLEANNPPN
ncbi:MAG: S9 family peptidase [Rhizomicrobium sp.]